MRSFAALWSLCLGLLIASSAYGQDAFAPRAQPTDPAENSAAAEPAGESADESEPSGESDAAPGSQTGSYLAAVIEPTGFDGADVIPVAILDGGAVLVTWEDQVSRKKSAWRSGTYRKGLLSTFTPAQGGEDIRVTAANNRGLVAGVRADSLWGNAFIFAGKSFEAFKTDRAAVNRVVALSDGGLAASLISGSHHLIQIQRSKVSDYGRISGPFLLDGEEKQAGAGHLEISRLNSNGDAFGSLDFSSARHPVIAVCSFLNTGKPQWRFEPLGVGDAHDVGTALDATSNGRTVVGFVGVGNATSMKDRKAARWSRGGKGWQLTLLAPDHPGETIARAINNRGVVVGRAGQDKSGVAVLFLGTATGRNLVRPLVGKLARGPGQRENNTAVDLNARTTLDGWTLTDAVGINSSGDILAIASNGDRTRPVLLTPQ